MGLALDREQTPDVIGPGLRLRAAAHRHDHVAQHALVVGRLRQRPFFHHFADAVVPDAADITALGGDDAVKQRKLGVAPVNDLQAVGRDGPLEDGAFVVRTAPFTGDVDARGDMAIHLERRVEAPFDQAAAGLGREQGGLRQARQGREPGGIDQGDRVPQVSQAGVTDERLELTTEFGDDLREPLGVEDADGVGERAQRGARAAKLLLHLAEQARLMQTAQGADDRVEQKEQDEQAVLVQVEGAIAGPTPLAADLLAALEQGRQLVKVLQTSEVLFLNRLRRVRLHTGKDAPKGKSAILNRRILPGANVMPNTIGCVLFPFRY